MKKIQVAFTLLLLMSSNGIGAKKPCFLRVETTKQDSNASVQPNNNKANELDLNASARLTGCQEALDSYAQQLEQLKKLKEREKSPLGSSERSLIELIIADAQEMQNIVTPTSPEMGQSFAHLICCAKSLRKNKES